jgi:mono/diheme cytochrome c family protein
MKRALLLVLVAVPLALLAGPQSSGPGGAPDAPHPASPAVPPTYVMLAWSELGMHCIDGKDYSVFSVLPPYNVVHAQLLQRGEPPVAITSGVTLTYTARADTQGSINTTSWNKTNFWTWVQALFHTNPPPDTGLTGNQVQSLTPHPMKFNANLKVWEVTGIPTMPYDDAMRSKPYPMGTITAKDQNGVVLATASVVFAVSDEMTCSQCHASNSDPFAKPKAGWENNSDPAKDVKLNILKKHDDRWNITSHLADLQKNGYYYQSTLYQTAKGGMPVLCAACHSTNALGAKGVPGVNPLTADMHTLHGPVLNLKTGTTLDKAKTPFASCYLCHPGRVTKCQRGPMNKVACYDCHGNLTKVGASTRAGWLDEPACQMCHTNSMRYPTTFDSNGIWRTTSDKTFATNMNKPITGKQLYRFSSGHGSVYCSGCHGSQHAEYPTLQANDNLYSMGIQGYKGKLVECSTCHTAVPTLLNKGPHTMHTIGQTWITAHKQYAQNGGYTKCAYCHGPNYTGLFLSKIPTARTFTVEDSKQKTFPAGHLMSCYDCHNGPQG